MNNRKFQYSEKASRWCAVKFSVMIIMLPANCMPTLKYYFLFRNPQLQNNGNQLTKSNYIASNVCSRKSATSFGDLPDSVLMPRRNRRHFADDIFKCIFLNENVWTSLKISLKCFLKGPINNISSLVQIMAWRRPGDKPLSEQLIASLPTHICMTRPQ